MVGRNSITTVAAVGLLLGTTVLVFFAIPVATGFTPLPHDGKQRCVEGSQVDATAVVTDLPDNEENGTVGLTVKYDVQNSVSRVSVTPSEPVTAVSGFENRDGKLVSKSPRDGNLSFTMQLGLDPDQASRLPQYEANKWVVFNTPSIRTHWAAGLTHHCQGAFEGETEIQSNGNVETAGNGRMMFAANKSLAITEDELHNGDRVSIVALENDRLNQEKRVAIIDLLSDVSRKMDVGCNRNMTMFALPEPQTKSGFATWSGDTAGIWVYDRYKVTNKWSTWLHEYVHGRQCMSLSEDMEWFKEGSANYLRTYYPQALDNDSSDSFDTFRVNSYNGTLANKSTWERNSIQYQKGAHVLVYTDAQIRRHSDQTIIDVIRWMNNQGLKITYERFRDHVVRLTNEEVGESLDRYVQTGADVEHQEWHDEVIFGTDDGEQQAS